MKGHNMTKQLIGKVDDLKLLFELLPKHITKHLETYENLNSLIEIVMDKGFCPEVRFSHTVYRLEELGEITQNDINEITTKIGQFNTDNRAGIERTLHRISAIRNRSGKIIGLTCRIGRAIEGTVDIIQDIVENGQNCLFLGPPGIGKTTLLREVARVLSTAAHKRVVVVDTSNEIAGDGDIPHPGIGYARRMQVPSPDKQHAIMIEAVENHMPEVIIVDEIGTEEETRASRTIAERGVQLVATAHGYQLENLIKNPTLCDLIGGFQNVILGDEEAKFRGTSKTVLERKGPPTFDAVIEIRARDTFAIYSPVANYIDAFLTSDPSQPEIRNRSTEKKLSVTEHEVISSQKKRQTSTSKIHTHAKTIFAYGINENRLKVLYRSLQVPLKIAKDISEADLILTTKSKVGPKSKINKMAKKHGVQLHIIPSQESEHITKFLRSLFKLTDSEEQLRKETILEAEISCKKVLAESRYIELSPKPSYLRTLQHEVAHKFGLNSMSVGEDPNRRLRVYPRI